MEQLDGCLAQLIMYKSGGERNAATEANIRHKEQQIRELQEAIAQLEKAEKEQVQNAPDD